MLCFSVNSNYLDVLHFLANGIDIKLCIQGIYGYLNMSVVYKNINKLDMDKMLNVLCLDHLRLKCVVSSIQCSYRLLFYLVFVTSPLLSSVLNVSSSI